MPPKVHEMPTDIYPTLAEHEDAYTAQQLSPVIALLQELKNELDDARKDIRWLKKQAGFGRRGPKCGAIITMPMSYEVGEPSIRLSVGQWRKVKRGEELRIKGSGLWVTDDVSFSDYWEFNTEGANSVILKTGLDDSDTNLFETATAKLADCDVEEIPSKRLKELSSTPITGNASTPT